MSSPVQLLKQSFEDLSRTNKKIARYVIDNPQAASEANIEDLAAVTETSTASVSRLVKTLGYANFREFTLSLAYTQLRPQNLPIFKDIDANDSLSTIADKIFTSTQRAIRDTREGIDENDFARAVLRIIHCRRLGLFGLGGSSVIALDGYHKFLRTSIDCFYYPDFDVQLMQAVKLGEDDCGIVVSHSGKNRQTLKIAETLKQRKVPVIGITGYPDSPLASHSDITFVSLSDESNYRSEGMYSLIAQMTIIDTLFMMATVRMGPATEDTIQNVQNIIESTRS
ncbi:MurR/RpiR family transcriptional regulator [Lentilactobacillus kisonensis]|uniref:RpiR family transcriptional regulator n=2 Tax=Lentilactobacillus kisonensis TaxID=481722 RepID=A0A0R1NSZ5_9LACO|nr:MurR/RpiR family transcriptional regulator [Lentilactobacillus kisonensis]KRL20602.1 RpiR family transcriptional regulator [Lentilactobacillus kisonensis DSM 19906 = JCM 15041]